MRTPASFVHRYLASTALGCTLLFACGGGESKKPGSDAAGSNGAGSGNAGTGGSASGGTTGTTGGDGSGGSGDTSSGGSDTGGNGSGGANTGGNGSGGDAGMPSTGGSSGSSSGNPGSGGDAGSGANAGSAGNAGSGAGGTPSAGCRAGGSATSGRVAIDVGGTMRDYIIKLPAGYDSTRPYRLIFTFHGRMYSAQTVADGGPPGSGPYYGIEALSGGSAIFVAPQALSTSWTNESGRDVAYVNAMVARFKTELCVDESRIFSVGFSMGAIMTLTVACTSESPFRAIAPMSASMPTSCANTEPLAYWGSHGTEDMTIRLDPQGLAVRDAFVARNGCSSTTMPGDRAGCVSYQGCDAGAPVTFCTFAGVHEPPPYAGDAIWAFLSQF